MAFSRGLLFSALLLSFNSLLHAQESMPLTNNGSDTNTTGRSPTTSLEGDTLPDAVPTSTEAGTDYNSATLEPSQVSSSETPANCQIEPTLGNYCSDFLTERASETVLTYFNLETSILALFGMFINEDTARALTSQCPTGTWCLPDEYHEKIYEGMTAFYESPICDDALWTCAESIAEYREDCEDENKLYPLLQMMTLLCDMKTVGDLQPECYTKTIEILHVLYSDSTRGAVADLDGPICDAYMKKIVKTLLCTIDACGIKQTVFLKEFSPLADIAINSEMVFIKCNLSGVCPGNTTLAPRADFSIDAKTTAMTNISDVPSVNRSETNDKILQEEMAEQNALDKVFDKLEQQIEQDERNRAEGKANAEESTSDSVLPTSNADVPSLGDASWDSGTSANDFGDGGGQNEMSDTNYTMGGDQTMLFGTITLSTLVLFGLLAAGFMSFRRFRAKRNSGYKNGYSQLSEEESRMLSYE